MTPSPLLDYLDKHKGETAYVFGKGPSLDRFRMEAAGSLRCAINDVVARVPDCTYAFANDSVDGWVDLYRPGPILFSPLRTKQPDGLACQLVRYLDDYCSERLATVSRHGLAVGPLSIERGTLGSVIQILWIMGVKKVVLVGVDGGQAHASGEWRTRLRNDHWRDYDAIRASAITLCGILGIEVECFRDSDQPRTNGTMKIKVRSSIFIQGSPYYAGQVADVPDQIGRALVANHQADAYTPPPRDPEPAVPPAPPVETADHPPAAEQAVSRPTRRGKAAQA